MKLSALGFALVALFGQPSFAITPLDPAQESICGKDDSRVPSKRRPVARMMETADDNAGCTGTLISKSCMISAGHCHDYLNVAQFNVPLSTEKGKLKKPSGMDIYELDQVIAYKNNGEGHDWSVYKVKPNAFSGKKAGDVQGFYKIKTAPVAFRNQKLRITGFGSDDQPNRNFAQQTAVGKLKAVDSDLRLEYELDTMPGNSGSSIILESSREIIGIHTNGGCYADGGTNAGTAIGNNTALQQAIQQCLSMDQ